MENTANGKKFFKTSEVRDDLSQIFRISDPTWAKMRRVLNIKGHSCSYAKMIGLWAYAAIRRDDFCGRIDKNRIADFIEKNGEDPTAWFPGFVPVSALIVPSFIEGGKIQGFFWSALRWNVSQTSIARYAKAVTGSNWSLTSVYTAEQVKAMIRYRCQILANQTVRQIENGKKLSKRRSA